LVSYNPLPLSPVVPSGAWPPEWKAVVFLLVRRTMSLGAVSSFQSHLT
jgi:hypothetical protein